MSAIPESTLPGHELLHRRVIAALELCQESRDVEFKGPASFPSLKRHIARTAMAMSNLRDGGLIVIGVCESDGIWTLPGIDAQTLDTYDEDGLNDYINALASPPIRVFIVRVVHRQAEFLVIQVPEFEQTPVVCKKDVGSDFHRGRVYVRPPGKPATTAVRDAEDMQELLALATEKRTRALLHTMARLGMRPPTSTDDAYDRELGGI